MRKVLDPLADLLDYAVRTKTCRNPGLSFNEIYTVDVKDGIGHNSGPEISIRQINTQI